MGLLEYTWRPCGQYEGMGLGCNKESELRNREGFQEEQVEEMNSKPGRGDAGQGRIRREGEGRERGSVLTRRGCQADSVGGAGAAERQKDELSVTWV